jgi:beta-lactamase class D
MKINSCLLFSIVISLLSCQSKTQLETVEEEPKIYDSLRPDFQHAFDSMNVSGTILIFDPYQQIYFSNDFQRADKKFLPASTFKIPNSIIGLETGVVENDSTMFKWDGQKRRLKIWEQDMMFRDAFHLSCVPCYQDIARKIGPVMMNDWLKKLEYGNMVVDSSNIDKFWLEGESGISARQQIDFLQRFYERKLPLSERTFSMMRSMMVIDSTRLYTISGKTGWSIRDGNNVGWFVGYAEQKNSVLYFATNLEPRQNFNMDMFPMIRGIITKRILDKWEWPE